MMLWLAWMAAGWAQVAPDLLAYPEPIAPVPHECEAPLGLEYGAPVPPSLVGAGGKLACAATLVPVSQALDLAAIEAWSVACGYQYTTVVAGLETDLHNTELDRDDWRERAEASRVGFWRKPMTNFVAGGIVTGLLVGGGITLAVAL